MNAALKIDKGLQNNEFLDFKAMRSSKDVHKLKNNSFFKPKISFRKLPPDFFQPSTKSNRNLNSIHFINRQGVLKTPSFGNDQPKLTKDKKQLQIQKNQPPTPTTPEKQIEQQSFRFRMRKNFSLEQEIHKKQQQFSHRQTQRKQDIGVFKRWSIQRPKIKFKKSTMNDQAYLDQKRMKKPMSQETQLFSESKKNVRESTICLYQQKLRNALSIQKKLGKLPPLF